MGIEDLGTFITEKLPHIKKYVKFVTYHKKRLAVDSDNWIYKYMSVAHANIVDATPIDQMLDHHVVGPVVNIAEVQQRWFGLMVDALCLWLDAGITPVFVFDGPTRPEKKATTSEREQRREKDLAKFEAIKKEYLGFAFFCVLIASSLN